MLAIIITCIMCPHVVHTMDTGESNKKTKRKTSDKAGSSSVRVKAISWPTAISEFVLDWYLEKKLELPPKVPYKKTHHTACTSTLNAKYDTTYTVNQVHRHFRLHRETWLLVARHLNESGGGWDDTNKMLILSQSSLDYLSVCIL